MAVYNPDAKIVVFDTDKFTGDFEREMCAFITGQFGDCGVGEGEAIEEAENIRHLGWFKCNIAQIEDDNAVARPASMWRNPDDGTSARSYTAVAIFLKELPPQEVLSEMIERAKLYCKNEKIEYKGYRVLVPTYQAVTVYHVTGHEDVSEAFA